MVHGIQPILNQGKETFSKWYAIINFNSAGKIVRFNDWFNADGLEKQIAQ